MWSSDRDLLGRLGRPATLTRSALACVGATLLACAGQALAQPVLPLSYPTRPVRLVVPCLPGTIADTIGRLVAPRLAEALGADVQVDNRPGASGSVGAGFVANGAADGHTLLVGALTSHAISGALFGRTVPFDLEQSFAPVSILGTVPHVVVVNPGVHAQSLGELIAEAKSKPGTITYASAGHASTTHLAGELLQHLAGVRMRHVPSEGRQAAIDSLLDGGVQAMVAAAPAARAHIEAGRMRALAVATHEPVALLPGVPTAAQAGLEGFEVSSLYGLVAPSGTPDAVLAKLNAAARTVMAMPEVRDALLAEGAFATWTSLTDAQAAVRGESAKWKKLVKDARLQSE